MKKTLLIGLLSLLSVVTTGCVRRTLTINTEPQGALVWLNDEEIGRSPASVDFLWYGDYDVVARMEGYETVSSHANIVAPWYQLPGIDFFSEVLYPGIIHDEQSVEFELTKAVAPETDELISHAEEFRAQMEQ